MGIRSALNQNYYMDSNEVMDAGERIRFVMAKVDICMGEADGLFCRISDLADSVPTEARCEALISACENARAGIRKIDFLEYGNRVSQNMFELVNYSDYVSSETIKGMEDIRVKLGGVRGTVAELQELLRFRAYSSNMNGSKLKVQVAEGTEAFCDLYDIDLEQQDEDEIDECFLAYQAARLAGLRTTVGGLPVINSAADYDNYMRFYNLSHQKEGLLEVVNGDGSTTVYYVCAMPYREAVNVQYALDGSSEPKVYRTGGLTSASIEEIYAAMLPCDHMAGSEKYQFLDLSNNKSFTIEDAKEMLEGQGILEGKEEAFINAAEAYNVNPVYLIAHAILETGHGTSELAQGYSYSGKTVYNMYGYGAVDGNALEGGANTAYENEWFTPEAAIIGGAERIAGSYIGKEEDGQPTLYEMRWNPRKPGQNQYATDIDWALKQVWIMGLQDIYNDVPPETMRYYIPVYPAE